MSLSSYAPIEAPCQGHLTFGKGTLTMVLTTRALRGVPMTETYPLPPVRVVQPFEDMTTWERTAHLLARHNLAAAELGTQVERHDRRHAMDLDLDHSHDAE